MSVEVCVCVRLKSFSEFNLKETQYSQRISWFSPNDALTSSKWSCVPQVLILKGHSAKTSWFIICIISHVLQICARFWIHCCDKDLIWRPFILCSFKHTSVKMMKTNISTDLRQKTSSKRRFWSSDVDFKSWFLVLSWNQIMDPDSVRFLFKTFYWSPALITKTNVTGFIDKSCTKKKTITVIKDIKLTQLTATGISLDLICFQLVGVRTK